MFKKEVAQAKNGTKIYMEYLEENNTFVKRVDIMLQKPSGEFTKVLSYSLSKVEKPSGLRALLQDLGLEREEVEDILATVLIKIQVADSTASTNDSMSIEQVHQYLTRCALRGDGGYMHYINSLGKECCAFSNKVFKRLIRENVEGYKNHLEVIRSFRMMEILHTNPGRNDYRLKEGEVVYCFLPAEGIKKDTFFDWFDAAPDAEAPKEMESAESAVKDETPDVESSASDKKENSAEVETSTEPEHTENA